MQSTSNVENILNFITSHSKLTIKDAKHTGSKDDLGADLTDSATRTLSTRLSRLHFSTDLANGARSSNRNSLPLPQYLKVYIHENNNSINCVRCLYPFSFMSLMHNHYLTQRKAHVFATAKRAAIQ